MRHAVIMAGGAGTRLWPMSRAARPKQLIPFLVGRSLLQLAYERLDPALPPDCRWVCANRRHEAEIRQALPALGPEAFLGEPVARDTLCAVGLAAAVIHRRDPDAVIAMFTADHVIGPVDVFRHIIDVAYGLVESRPATLATFGIRPTGPATGYGYLELGDAVGSGIRRVTRFREKPSAEVAREYVAAGPNRYLWNSGMFVWKASTLLACIARYRPDTAAGLDRIARAWEGPDSDRILAAEYDAFPKISVDYAVMEPASRDPAVTVVAVPMDLEWTDVGSWAALSHVCPRDADGNTVTGGRALFVDCRGVLAASDDPAHLIAALGCEGLVIVHTDDATLVCPAALSERVKDLHRRAAEAFGGEFE